jgi:hypothetical protein
LCVLTGVVLVAAASAGVSAAHEASLQAAQAAPTIATAADAKPFLGTWTTTFDTPQGAATFDIEVHMDTGDPGATVRNDLIGEAAVTDVTKSGSGLVLKFVVDVQGMQIPVVLTLVPDGDKLKADFSFLDGQFAVSSIASRKK